MSFIRKIEKVRNEKRTDVLSGMAKKYFNVIKFAFPPLGWWLSYKYNQGRAFSREDAAICSLPIDFCFFYNFETECDIKVDYTFHELKFFRNLRFSTDHFPYAASKCSEHLTELTFPDNLTDIPDRMFIYCKALRKVHLPENLKIMSNFLMNRDLITQIKLPEGLETTREMMTFAGTSVSELKIPPLLDSMSIYACCNCPKLKNVDFSRARKLTYIGMGAFSNCKLIEGMDLPDTVDDLGSEVFNECSSLKSMRIPPKVKSLGSLLFGHCIKLESVDIPKRVGFIDYRTFVGCSSLKRIVYRSEFYNHYLFDSLTYAFTNKFLTPELMREDVGKWPEGLELFVPEETAEEYRQNFNVLHDTPLKIVGF